MSNIRTKPEADKDEGIRLAFNYLYYTDKTKGHRGYINMPNKIEFESLLRQWFVNNLEGLPETEK